MFCNTNRGWHIDRTATTPHVVQLLMLSCKLSLASELSSQVIASPDNPPPLLAAISLVKLLLSLIHCILHYAALCRNVLSKALGRKDRLMNRKYERSIVMHGDSPPHARWTSRVRSMPQMISGAIVASSLRWVFIRIVRRSFIYR